MKKVSNTNCPLQEENRRFANTAGVSANNQHCGCRPAFRDNATGNVFLSCFADGRPAPIHLLEGLPKEVIEEFSDQGRALRSIPSLESGFVKEGRFYNRSEMIRALAKEAG